ncbi:MAG: hypothetical protein HND48_17460 [Chloroflexi bacterium]|nr:hypothetical protein [Chloroflexota bacterium]
MPLSNRDYDLLSAYLDGAVSNDERREIEGRLETDAEFASELAALRRMVELVKGLPTLVALRDLRLTPAMLGEEQPVSRTEPTRYPPLRPHLPSASLPLRAELGCGGLVRARRGWRDHAAAPFRSSADDCARRRPAEHRDHRDGDG